MSECYTLQLELPVEQLRHAAYGTCSRFLSVLALPLSYKYSKQGVGQELAPIVEPCEVAMLPVVQLGDFSAL